MNLQKFIGSKCLEFNCFFCVYVCIDTPGASQQEKNSSEMDASGRMPPAKKRRLSPM